MQTKAVFLRPKRGWAHQKHHPVFRDLTDDQSMNDLPPTTTAQPSRAPNHKSIICWAKNNILLNWTRLHTNFQIRPFPYIVVRCLNNSLPMTTILVHVARRRILYIGRYLFAHYPALVAAYRFQSFANFVWQTVLFGIWFICARIHSFLGNSLILNKIWLRSHNGRVRFKSRNQTHFK